MGSASERSRSHPPRMTMSDLMVTFLVSRLAIATVEFLMVGFLVAGVLAVCTGIAPRWRRMIWLLALAKPGVTLLTGFLGGLIPAPSMVTGKLLGDVLFPVAADSAVLASGGFPGFVMRLVAYGWIVVTALLLVRVWLRAAASRQLVDESVEKGYLLKPSTLKRLDAGLVVPPHARIIVTPEDAGPAALGVLHPAVVIPESMVPWVNQHRDPTPGERARLCQVLRHEVAHLTNRDSLVSMLATILVSFFWFHPIAHWAYHRVRLNNELCCDETVVGSGVPASAYIETLMTIVTGKFSRRVFSLSILGDVGPRNVLRRRLRYLLADCDRSRPPRVGLAYAVMVLLVLTMPRFLAGPAHAIPILLASGEVKMVSFGELEQYPGAIPLTEAEHRAVLDGTSTLVLARGPIVFNEAARRVDPAADSMAPVEVVTLAQAEASKPAVPPELPKGDALADLADQEDVEVAAETPPRSSRHSPSRSAWGTDVPIDPVPSRTPILPPLH